MAGLYDLPSEIQWWDEYLRSRPAICDLVLQQKAFPPQLLCIGEQLKAQGTDGVRLLEVGSGPVSLLAWGVQKHLFDLKAVDPLAAEYQQLLGKYGFDYPVKPIKGYAENLLAIFPERSFDVAYSSNALDHVLSPRKCIENICSVVKPGGFICLEGFCREGTNAKWVGLHQHDLLVENGHLLHFNKRGDRAVLTENMRLKCTHENIMPFADRTIESFGYESTVPGVVSDWHYRDWYTIVFRVGG
jgi:SAM-dependent methyltransferase